MAGTCRENWGQTGWEELADKLGIEGDSEEFIAAMRKWNC
jgi:hypothetical protein